MTELAVLRAEAAAARAAAAGGSVRAVGVPGSPQRDHIKFGSELRADAEMVVKDGHEWYRVEGYASVYETPYDMWDEFGPYAEVVSRAAGQATLKTDPLVKFRVNHTGDPMATTQNGRLEISEDETGLHMRALLNPKRDDVQRLMHAINDGDVTEQSFMFTIDRGTWSPDYTEYRIEQFSLDRGDVGPVTYGANPYTSIAARSGEILAALRNLPPLAAREAREILSERSEAPVEPVVDDAADRAAADAEVHLAIESVRVKPLPKHEGRSVATWRNILLVDDEL